MNRRYLLGSLAAALVLVGGLWRWSMTRPVVEPPADATAVPVRIASLTLATDEILAELVPADRMVCVTALADDPEISNVPGFYPPEVQRLRDSSPESVLALRPDLVFVASYNSADFLKVLERSGLPVYRNEAYAGMDRIESAILDMGQRIGDVGRAQAIVERMQARRHRLQERLAMVSRRPRVLFWSAGFTAGRNTSIDDIIREAGGTNVAAELALEGSVAISPEQVIAADPEFLLLARWSADDRQNRIETDPVLGNLRAVRAGRVLRIDGRYLTTISQHVVEGAERLARQLHPDCFSSTPGNAP